MAKPTDLYQNFVLYVEKKKLLPQGRIALILGLSSGVDSVCLLDLLLRYKSEYKPDLTLIIHHQHHGIRQETADRDLLWAKELADVHGLEFHTNQENVPALAQAHRVNLEEMGRYVRYKNWSDLREAVRDGYDEVLITTAHHAGDQAETVLMHLAYGASLDGISGMRPRDAFYIKPLLFAEKSEIYAYAKLRRLTWFEDETNLDMQYKRNFIRNEVLPLWQSYEHKNLVKNIAHTAERVQDIQAYIDEIMCKITAELMVKNKYFFMEKNRDYYLTREFQDVNPLIKSSLIVHLFKKNGLLENYSTKQINDCVALIDSGQGEKALDLASGYTLFRNNKFFFFYRKKEAPFDFLNLSQTASYVISGVDLLQNKRVIIPSSNWILTYANVDNCHLSEDLCLPKSLLEEIEIRPYRPNAKTYLNNVSLKEVFASVGIPISIRQKLPIVLWQNKVLAIGPLNLFTKDDLKHGSMDKSSFENSDIIRLLWYNSEDIL